MKIKGMTKEEMARFNDRFEKFYAERVANPAWEDDEKHDARLWDERYDNNNEWDSVSEEDLKAAVDELLA